MSRMLSIQIVQEIRSQIRDSIVHFTSSRPSLMETSCRAYCRQGCRISLLPFPPNPPVSNNCLD